MFSITYDLHLLVLLILDAHMVWHSSIHSGMLASQHCVGLFYAGPFIVHMDGFNVFSIAALCIDCIYFALWSGFFIFDFSGLHSKPYAS